MNLKDAFAGIRDAQAPAPPSPQAPKRLSAEAPKRPGLPTQGTAKSKHPDYEPVKIYIRKDTRKRAWRKWEDVAGGDFSELVQQLLEKYLGT
jgi:hypothetical protein